MMCTILMPLLCTPLRSIPVLRESATIDSVESGGVKSMGGCEQLLHSLLRYSHHRESRLNNRPVSPPQCAPLQIERRVVLDRKFRGQLLVQLHAPPGLVIGV